MFLKYITVSSKLEKSSEFRNALVIENSVFCNISVWGVINYSMTVLSMGKYLKCDGLCKYLSSTKLLYLFFFCNL